MLPVKAVEVYFTRLLPNLGMQADQLTYCQFRSAPENNYKRYLKNKRYKYKDTESLELGEFEGFARFILVNS